MSGADLLDATLGVGKAIAAPFGLASAGQSLAKGDAKSAAVAAGTTGVAPAAEAGTKALSPSPPDLPASPEAPPAPPERTDPAIATAAARARAAELKKRGRASTILTSPIGDIGTAPLGRPAAGSGQLGA